MPAHRETTRPELRIVRRRSVDLDPELASWVRPLRTESAPADPAAVAGPVRMGLAAPQVRLAAALTLIGLIVTLASILR